MILISLLNPKFIDFKYLPFKCRSGGHSNNLSGSDSSGTEYTFLQFCVTQNIEIAADVAIRHELGGLEFKQRWAEIIRTNSERPRGPPSQLCNGYRVSFRGAIAVGAWR